MTIEKLKRVMWRVRYRNKNATVIVCTELERAVMYEIGTDRRTYLTAKKALIKLGWIVAKGPKHFILTGNEL